MFLAGAWMQVPIIMMRAPVNIPARRPKWSLTGPVRMTAGMEPMLYIAKTIPVEEPLSDLKVCQLC